MDIAHATRFAEVKTWYEDRNVDPMEYVFPVRNVDVDGGTVGSLKSPYIVF
jgi:hypothetical protein